MKCYYLFCSRDFFMIWGRYIKVLYAICGSAGIGRQARLRILCLYRRVGSSPISRSKKRKPWNDGVSFFIGSSNYIMRIYVDNHQNSSL